MRTNKIVAMVSVLLCTIMLSACGGVNSNEASQKPQNSPASQQADNASEASAATEEKLRTVTDDLGHVLQIPTHPQRVLAPYLEDPLTVLGVKPVAQWSNGDIVQQYLQTDLAGIPKVDFSSGGLDPEQAASHNPDLIILIFESWAEKGMYEAYSKIAPTYVFVDGMSDWRKTLRTLGDLLGQTDQAEKSIQDYDAKVAEAKQQIQQSIGDEEVVLLWPSGKNLFLLSALDYSGKLLYEELGITEPSLAHGQSFQSLSLEKLPELGSAHIFLITQYNDTEAKELQNKSVWQGLPAVKEGRITEISWNHWMNNGLIANQLNLEDTLKALVK
ncbi:ABC transporter substrate-binding protein [Paenibacillus radicis (ex Gao et al. 2016)]|uniref:Ferrichrome ABC transporter substrate-binding protein n=1 Tax=Paenibacillus radicis (ex Gao et al. 2016) TaxID=1737354 RepID=A0A917LZS5_9BACL|nr:ABC transporter substrate-binding protein [Paenibacillus radicis (ex Gao et al. 2016)]GGG68051.1 ferrichrome ABC transporter substrate-binding protein [Paenibacillus radicis (ex Gao et al. 2016)]